MSKIWRYMLNTLTTSNESYKITLTIWKQLRKVKNEKLNGTENFCDCEKEFNVLCNVLWIASAKSQSARRAYHQPTLMVSCLNFNLPVYKLVFTQLHTFLPQLSLFSTILIVRHLNYLLLNTFITSMNATILAPCFRIPVPPLSLSHSPNLDCVKAQGITVLVRFLV